MSRAPSYRSSYHDPYDEADVLELPMTNLKGELMKDGVVVGGAVTVDHFAYEVGRIHNEVEKLPSSVARIADLRAQAVALDPIDNSLVAQSLLADLAVQTSAVFDVLPTHIAETGSFASKVAVLKPAVGRLLVTAGETAELKAELARCALWLDSALQQISDGAKAEERDKKEARVRLLKVIKARLGDRGTPAELMSLLLTAEREGNAARPEKLKPLSYIPSFTSTGKQPSGYVAPSTADTSLATAEGGGSYGERLVPVPPKRSSRWVKWVILLLALVFVGLAVLEIVYLSKRVDERGKGGQILGAPGHAIAPAQAVATLYVILGSRLCALGENRLQLGKVPLFSSLVLESKRFTRGIDPVAGLSLRIHFYANPQPPQIPHPLLHDRANLSSNIPSHRSAQHRHEKCRS
ncbi:hypothetical protein JCM10295v2_000329 [Rhodotorula toruloides]